jgi:hypothetical protein
VSRASAALSLAMLLAACTTVLPSSPVQSTDSRPTPGTSIALGIPTPTRIAGGTCPVTPFETIPANDVVGWDQPTWQLATAGLWAHPFLSEYTAQSGFPASDREIKILWWTLVATNDPMIVTVSSIPVGGFSVTQSFDPPGLDRRDRPTGFGMPPPGCYEIRVTVGARSGVVVDQVMP